MYRKKLIEVSVPLEAINAESAREKSIRHGHPSTLHLWWARRPLAACRAVLFASLVDDPSGWVDKFPTKELQDKERQRLHDIIGKFENESSTSVRGLVSWDDIKDSRVIEEAQKEIARSLAWNNGDEPPTQPEDVRKYLEAKAPKIYDPFCGGGSIPLEAQRLGLEAHGSDLNPVAVLITKALIEIPPKFKNLAPVHPAVVAVDGETPKKGKGKKQAADTLSMQLGGQYFGAQGLAADVRYYGLWMRDEAQKRIGHLYPQVELATGGEATVIAWLWARTVKCPNPRCGIHTPLLSSFVLSSKKGKESYLIPEVSNQKVAFSISSIPTDKWGDPKKGLKRGMSGVFECIACGTVTTRNYVSEEAKNKRLAAIQTAVVVEGKKGRSYLPPSFSPCPTDIPTVDLTGLDIEFSPNPRDLWCRNFGLDTPSDLFTDRQLVAMTTFSDLVQEARTKILADAMTAGMIDDKLPLNDGGKGAIAYADAVATYLAFGVSRMANTLCTIARWTASREQTVTAFARQAIPMTWDYPEVNPFANAAGDLEVSLDSICKAIENLPTSRQGIVKQLDATSSDLYGNSIVVSTDPPYYDNIGYADLSDFFYVWLRRSLGSVYPDLFNTLVVPKAEELVAKPYRFGGNKQKAKEFFEAGLYKTFQRMREMAHEGYPLTVYYAFKQQETEGNDDNLITASSGWETMLEGLIRAGFTITGTLPMRTELNNRMVASDTNALASSIALICRPCPVDATSITRRQFLKELQQELPLAIANLQQGNLAPVDMAQASIGPGMGVFSRYKAVRESDGSEMRVRTALQLINRTLDEFLNEQEGEFDGDTRWALTWFEQHQYEFGEYGEAETLSRAKSTSIKGLETAGILAAKGGKVKLLTRQELPAKWIPAEDERIPVWEATQHLIRTLEQQGEVGTATLLMELGDKAENARDLAYRLYSICEAKGWTQEAIAYNSLVSSWSEISRLSLEVKPLDLNQQELNLN
jgi:putative DNA methylase